MPTTRSRRTEFTVGRPDPPSLHDVADAGHARLAFKALANETRRGILAVLHDWGGSLSSHDIARRFDIPWQGVSRHLRLLTEAGLITCDVRRNGRAYTLEPRAAAPRARPLDRSGRHARHADQGREAGASTSPSRRRALERAQAAAVLERPAQEGLDLRAVHRAPHGGQGGEEDAAVRRRGQARVEHGHHAAVVRVADQAARALGQQRGGPGEVDHGEGPAARPVAAGLEQRVVGSREGEAVDGHERERAARDVDALPEAERGEEAGGLVPGELLEQPALGQIALEQERVGESRAPARPPPPGWPGGW